SPLVLVSCLAGAIQILSRSHARAEQLFLSRELRFRKHERRLDLLARRFFRSFIQSEKRLSGRHLLAALHRQRLQLSSKWRRDINEFAFDITLETFLRRVATTADQEKQ